MKISRKQISYQAQSTKLFDPIALWPWAVFLDSCQPYSEQGQFDILAAKPYLTLETYGHKTLISNNDKQVVSTEDPFTLLDKYCPKVEIDDELPFHGGAIGYFSYDLSRRIENVPTLAKQDCPLPHMAVGIYSWAIIVDHQQQQSWLVWQDEYCSKAFINELLAALSSLKMQALDPFKMTSKFQANMDKAYYAKAFKKIMNYIRAGDCYEVNFTQRFQGTYSGSTWHAYQQLRQNNPAPFAAYLKSPSTTILCCSPERFLKLKAGIVESKPIKGTRGRCLTNHDQDEKLKQELLHSEKDRSENLMIVDLIRNDLGKSCEIGSIKVPKLFNLESFKNVHHLVSTISGRLAHNKSSMDLLRGCFPGGSISGTPKIRAMEIIEELEPHRRQIYCGSIGYVDVNGNMDTNITIRSLYTQENNIYCAAGGALVADSDVDEEYEESLLKVRNMLALLTSTSKLS